MLVGVGGGIGEEGIDCFEARGQAGQIEAYAADERGLVSLGCGAHSFGFEPGKDEAIDRVPRPGGVAHGGRRRPFGGDERPVFLPGCSLRDPALERRDLCRSEPLRG